MARYYRHEFMKKKTLQKCRAFVVKFVQMSYLEMFQCHHMPQNNKTNNLSNNGYPSVTANKEDTASKEGGLQNQRNIL